MNVLQGKLNLSGGHNEKIAKIPKSVTIK